MAIGRVDDGTWGLEDGKWGARGWQVEVSRIARGRAGALPCPPPPPPSPSASSPWPPPAGSSGPRCASLSSPLSLQRSVMALRARPGQASRQAGKLRTAAPAASQGPPDPLTAEYTVRTDAMLGCGADGGVVRGVHLVSGRWRALKFMSRHAYSHARELDLLGRLQHPNIIPLLQTFAPVLPQRPQWVSVMPEADCNLREFMRRRAGWGGGGAAFIMLASETLCVAEAASPGPETRSDLARWSVLLADFSRSHDLQPQRRLRRKAPVCEPLTTNVCTPNSVAPEAVQSGDEGDRGPGGLWLACGHVGLRGHLFRGRVWGAFCRWPFGPNVLALVPGALGPEPG